MSDDVPGLGLRVGPRGRAITPPPGGNEPARPRLTPLGDSRLHPFKSGFPGDIVTGSSVAFRSIPMAPRANWKGFLRLSLVTCPVALYPATSDTEKVSFNQINRKTGHRIKY